MCQLVTFYHLSFQDDQVRSVIEKAMRGEIEIGSYRTAVHRAPEPMQSKQHALLCIQCFVMYCFAFDSHHKSSFSYRKRRTQCQRG